LTSSRSRGTLYASGEVDVVAVIQAGGKGVRLHPYTIPLPKPLMPIGDLPIIELIIKWLRKNGVPDIYITIGYLGRLIQALCGDGSQWDTRIRYSVEPEPLGTIGPLKLLQGELTKTFFNVNADLVTDLNLRSLKSFHARHGGLVTVAVTERVVKSELGVFDIEGDQMVDFHEKPEIKYQASCGAYCMEPGVLDLIPKGVPFGFDDLMRIMLDQKLPVYVYQHKGLWLDLGREEDLRNAQQAFDRDYKMRILGC